MIFKIAIKKANNLDYRRVWGVFNDLLFKHAFYGTSWPSPVVRSISLYARRVHMSFASPPLVSKTQRRDMIKEWYNCDTFIMPIVSNFKRNLMI